MITYIVLSLRLVTFILETVESPCYRFNCCTVITEKLGYN